MEETPLHKYVPNPADLISVQEQLLQRDMILYKLKHNLRRAQQIMKTYANQKWMNVEIKCWSSCNQTTLGCFKEEPKTKFEVLWSIPYY